MLTYTDRSWFNTHNSSDPIGTTSLYVSVEVAIDGTTVAQHCTRVPLVEVPRFDSTEEMQASTWYRELIDLGRIAADEKIPPILKAAYGLSA